MHTSDRDLLVAVARGSDRAARELWSRHAGRLRAFLSAILPAGGPVDADDVLQQAFCRVLETSVGELRRVEDVPAWLFQVARHIAFNDNRGERRRRERVRRLADGGASESPAAARPRDEALWAALGTLMPDVRDLVLMKHIGGLTFDQIAIATQTNRSTTASRYRAAIEMLERALAEPKATASRSLEVSHG